MACKITKSLKNDTCEYSVAGASKVWLANWHPGVTVQVPGEAPAPIAGTIQWVINADGVITDVVLPTGEFFYEVDGPGNTLGFTDALLAGANGNKYRQHTVNYSIAKLDADILTEGDALSLGTFVAVVLDKAGRIVVLGRLNGLTAPANGFDYNSGLASADAAGWTGILQGEAGELTKLVANAAVIAPVFVSPVVVS